MKGGSRGRAGCSAAERVPPVGIVAGRHLGKHAASETVEAKKLTS